MGWASCGINQLWDLPVGGCSSCTELVRQHRILLDVTPCPGYLPVGLQLTKQLVNHRCETLALLRPSLQA